MENLYCDQIDPPKNDIEGGNKAPIALKKVFICLKS
jgi:hypothetical protein